RVPARGLVRGVRPRGAVHPRVVHVLIGRSTKEGFPMASRQVALIRGINVGRAKRVAMADLRVLVEGLGYGDVRTLLNSGNVVFTTPRAAPGNAAARIEKALATELGVSARVTVLTAKELADAVSAN